MDATNKTVTVKRVNVRYLTVTAMLSAVAYILMFLDFSVPFMPSFIKMDLSELPALIGSFAMGPLCGVIICLVKNVLHLFITSTGGVGELSNFILGVAFVLPAGLLYKYKKTRTTALIGSVLGAVIMGAFSVVSNYFLGPFPPAKLLPPVMAASISSSVIKCWTVGTWESSEEKVLRGRSRSFRFSQISLGL